MRRYLLVLAAVVGLATTITALAPPAASQFRLEEMNAPRPSWFTDALADQVHAAGSAGVPLPAGVEVPASGLAFTGIRPGSWMISPSGCTLNFVFGTNSHIGTAGHCADVGERVVIIAAPGILMEIGTTVESRDNGIGDDFALIDIDAGMRQYVNPSTAYFGGPTGVIDPKVGDAVLHSGHGLVIGTGGTPRAGVVTYRGPGEGGDAYGWTGLASLGDSGSGVIRADGRAAGNLTHLVVGSDYLPANVTGTTADRMQSIAGLPIATAPIGPDPLF